MNRFQTVVAFLALFLLVSLIGTTAAPGQTGRDDVLRASRIEITNAQGKTIFSVHASEKGDGELTIFDSQGLRRFAITMPHPEGKVTEIKVSLLNENKSETVRLQSEGGAGSGALQLCTDGLRGDVGSVAMAANALHGGNVFVNNHVGKGVISLLADPAGAVTVRSENGGTSKSLAP